MNADTVRSINQIKANNYWRQGETLGEGGWGEVYKFAADWNQYLLFSMDEIEPICVITAKDDNAAKIAFSNLFHLDKFDHEIWMKEVKLTLIKES